MSEAIATHEVQSVAEGKAVQCSWTSRQESSSYGPVAPLHCSWAPAWGQLRSFVPGTCSGPENVFSLGDGNKQSSARATWWWIPTWLRSAKGRARRNFFCPNTIFLGKRQSMFGGMSGWPILLGTFSTRSLQVMAAWQRKPERGADFCLGYKGWPSLPTALPKGLAECVVLPQKLYPFAFHRFLIKEGFTCFISTPISNTAVIQPGSQVAVRSIKRWVVKPWKCIFCHKPETSHFFLPSYWVLPNSRAAPTLEIPLCFATFALPLPSLPLW